MWDIAVLHPSLCFDRNAIRSYYGSYDFSHSFTQKFTSIEVYFPLFYFPLSFSRFILNHIIPEISISIWNWRTDGTKLMDTSEFFFSNKLKLPLLCCSHFKYRVEQIKSRFITKNENEKDTIWKSKPKWRKITKGKIAIERLHIEQMRRHLSSRF